MTSPLLAPGGCRSWTGFRLVLGGFLALAAIVGMLAMHNLHLDFSHTSQSPTAATLAMHAAAPSVVVAAADDGPAAPIGAACPNCSPGEISMMATCLSAVVLGLLLLLLLPWRLREGGFLPQLRAGPRRGAAGLFLHRAPSLNVLCINRC